MRKVALAAVLFLCWMAGSARAQNDGQAPPARGQLRLYLDCRTSCDGDFVRTELPFLDHVRDIAEADVHVLVTTQQTGAGGNAYTMKFIGRNTFRGLDDELGYATPADATPDVKRRALVAHLSLGLGRYLARTEDAGRLRLTAPGTGAPAPALRADRWNYWVFSLSGNGYLSGEHLQRYFSGYGYLTANRITPQWKTRLTVNGSYNENRFDMGDGSIVLSASRQYGVGILQVRSLDAHWSAGFIAGGDTYTYANRRLGLSAAPALEYDVFPYAQSTRRQLALRYAVGPGYVRYKETTIYERDHEAIPMHELVAQLTTKQPWGSTNVTLTGNQFLSHLKQYSLGGYGSLSVRIAKGLSAQGSLDLTMLRNQRGLPRGNATTEEILLRRRELETAYRYWSSFGLSYSFGSMLNNVVNSRFPSAGFMFASF